MIPFIIFFSTAFLSDLFGGTHFGPWILQPLTLSHCKVGFNRLFLQGFLSISLHQIITSFKSLQQWLVTFYGFIGTNLIMKELPLIFTTSPNISI